jgi:hypothetical protein
VERVEGRGLCAALLTEVPKETVGKAPEQSDGLRHQAHEKVLPYQPHRRSMALSQVPPPNPNKGEDDGESGASATDS